MLTQRMMILGLFFAGFSPVVASAQQGVPYGFERVPYNIPEQLAPPVVNLNLPPHPTGPYTASTPAWGPGGDAASGLRVGTPYYWSAHGTSGVAPGWVASPAVVQPTYGYGYTGNAAGPDVYYGGNLHTPYGASSLSGSVITSDPYSHHFGPGFHRSSDAAHHRFPFYNYRAPWYYPGAPSYTRDTNYPW